MAFWLFKKMYFSEIHIKLGKDTITGCTEFILNTSTKTIKILKRSR